MDLIQFGLLETIVKDQRRELKEEKKESLNVQPTDMWLNNLGEPLVVSLTVSVKPRAYARKVGSFATVWLNLAISWFTIAKRSFILVILHIITVDPASMSGHTFSICRHIWPKIPAHMLCPLATLDQCSTNFVDITQTNGHSKRFMLTLGEKCWRIGQAFWPQATLSSHWMVKWHGPCSPLFYGLFYRFTWTTMGLL